ncbi:hypothetical protein KVT40_009210 [Elsinoe batatas]|uniref:Uncharacterized protein n=1 Tax=Elsinoe batatas TaxID=2601811 RepID=A0A8K0KUJ5_9PEZI|nr:hypothetical protein KVT40_009210 [Elsinoe batatas]
MARKKKKGKNSHRKPAKPYATNLDVLIEILNRISKAIDTADVRTPSDQQPWATQHVRDRWRQTLDDSRYLLERVKASHLVRAGEIVHYSLRFLLVLFSLKRERALGDEYNAAFNAFTHKACSDLEDALELMFEAQNESESMIERHVGQAAEDDTSAIAMRKSTDELENGSKDECKRTSTDKHSADPNDNSMSKSEVEVEDLSSLSTEGLEADFKAFCKIESGGTLRLRMMTTLNMRLTWKPDLPDV